MEAQDAGDLDAVSQPQATYGWTLTSLNCMYSLKLKFVKKKKKKKFFFNVLHAQMLIVEYWFIVHLQACGFLNFPSVYFPCIFIK